MIDGFKIIGGQALEGEVSISGSKNAALPIIAACLIEEGEYILENVPELRDIRTMFKLLKEMGLFVEKLEENKYKVINNGINNIEAPYDLVKTMRASFLVMGPLLASKQRAKVSLPGGCAIGARPVNYHLKGFEELGCTINIKHGYVEAVCEKLTGDKIVFEFPSVGATENLIMAAVKASGTTILENCAKEPEIEDLCNFLIKMGADISGIGTSTLKIKGKEKLTSCNYKILADRIEAGTFIIASILANGKIKVKDFELNHLDSFLQKLEEMGIEFEGDNNGFSAKIKNKLKSTRISTMPYPGFPTDLQAQMTILMCLAGGTSEVKENIFENRYMHIPELNRMGADINVDGKLAIVKGVDKFYSAEVMASDLRAGASLVLAALLAEGETVINRIYHIDRGYEKLEEKLKGIGAKIERIKLGVN